MIKPFIRNYQYNLIKKQMLEKISTLNMTGEFHHYLSSLEPCMTEFAHVIWALTFGIYVVVWMRRDGPDRY